MFDLTGRTALVTGAGRHVGEGIARALASAGASVLVNDLVAERAEAVAADIGATALPFDVTDPTAVAGALDGRPVDIVVNNAGIPAEMRLAPFTALTPADWRPYVDLNLYGSLHCIQAALPGMIERGWGRIVQISSGAGQAGVAMGISLYGASKSAVEGFIRHLAQEVATTGVTANAIALGLMGPGEHLAKRVPVGRIGTPADAGAAVVYVSSPEAGWLTGQTIQLNGGQF